MVYSSDQGFYLGEHGWFDKRWIFEESLRTPLLVRWPGVAKPGTVKQGHRLQPRLRRDVPRRRRRADSRRDAGPQPRAAAQGPDAGRLAQELLLPLLRVPRPHHVRPHYGVVTDRYKLVHFYEPDVDYWELFDLQKDPHELRSVYGEPDYSATRKELEIELARLRAELKVPSPDAPETYASPSPAGSTGRRRKRIELLSPAP